MTRWNASHEVAFRSGPEQQFAIGSAFADIFAGACNVASNDGANDFIVSMRELICECGGAGLPDDLRPVRVLDPETAGLYLGLAVRTLRWHRQQRSGPAYLKFATKIGYRVTDLDEWLNRMRVEPKKPARRRGRPRRAAGE